MAATTPIVDEVSTLNLMNHVRSLAQWVRTSGSAEEAKAFDYLQEQLTSFGYNVTRYESDALIGLPGESLLTIAGENEEIIPSNGYAFGGVTPDAGVSGEIVFVGFGRKDDYAGLDVTGKIVLADGIAMPDKVLKAFEAGAVALININDDHFHEMCISPVWGTPIPETAALLPTLPTLSVLRADGEYLKARIEAGTLTARIVTKPTLTDGKLPTLIGDLPAESATDGTFALFSGHVDSWHYGAMDNGTANATQLEVARLLADRRDDLKRGVRIAFWSGHSHSRYGGSAWYADTFWHELHERCICHVNIDSVGAITADYLTSSGTMAETHAFGAEVVAELTGQTLGYSRMSRSSDQSFWGHGIPSLFAALSQQGGPDDHNPFGLGWWWHTTEDLLDKVNPENLQRDASVFALALWRLCTVDRLPFDYANVANEIDGTLAAYQAQAGDTFDLSGTRDLAQQLATAVAAVNLDAAAFNTLAIELGRILIPVNYTAWGPFEQDLALGTVPLPGLREIVTLPGLAGRDALYLRTKLVRERNRIEHALRTALRLTQG